MHTECGMYVLHSEIKTTISGWLFQKVSASLIQVITSLPGSISPQASLHGIEPLAVTQEVIYGFLLMILAYTA